MEIQIELPTTQECFSEELTLYLDLKGKIGVYKLKKWKKSFQAESCVRMCGVLREQYLRILNHSVFTVIILVFHISSRKAQNWQKGEQLASTQEALCVFQAVPGLCSVLGMLFVY